MDDAIRYHLLKHLSENPHASQRDLAKHLGLSLSKTHYCVRALIDKGWVKMQNFQRSDKKLAYAYHLTPQGIEAKLKVTARFLERKRAEYDRLQAEIAQLAAEVAEQQCPTSQPATPPSDTTST